MGQYKIMIVFVNTDGLHSVTDDANNQQYSKVKTDYKDSYS